MNLPDRKTNLLKIIVEEYIKSATPVSSTFIVEKYFPDLSSATIRNDMAELETDGLICQPHTSAGRTPTLAGYKNYLENFVADGEISSKEKEILSKIKISNFRIKVKEIAKALAELADNAAFVGFDKNDYFYTGISNLFRQPEFKASAYLYDMSDIIDHLDEAISQVSRNLPIGQVKILVGNDNPFGEFSSVILAKYGEASKNSLIGLLGPNRLNYRQGMGLISYVQELLAQ